MTVLEAAKKQASRYPPSATTRSWSPSAAAAYASWSWSPGAPHASSSRVSTGREEPRGPYALREGRPHPEMVSSSRWPCPDAFDLQDLAKEYGADRNRFEKEPSFCIHCGLCVRYCAEVKKKHAIASSTGASARRSASFPRSPRRSAGTARSASPVSHRGLQAAYVLVESLAFPAIRRKAGK